MSIRARQLRRNQTDAEARLWRALRNRQLCGFKFRRQYSIPPYIADFACVEAGLIVELDGSQHQDSKERDAIRSSHLAKMGFRTVRYWDNDVLLRTHEVLEAILQELCTPHPHPSPERRREVIPSPYGRGSG